MALHERLKRSITNARDTVIPIPDASLSSILLELRVQQDALLAETMGHQVHALFLNLLGRTDPTLSTLLHDTPAYRPFTLSPLLGGRRRGNRIHLQGGQCYHIRVTLLKSERLWYCLSRPLVEEGAIEVRLGETPFLLTRILSTSEGNAAHLVSQTTWQALSQSPINHTVALSFVSPTAFNINGQYFSLFPEPLLVWESLLRVWNLYAPESLQMERQVLREFVHNHVSVSACELSTRTLHYPKYTQKGFMGTCTYTISHGDEKAKHIACLAAFAPYAGVGYKTTMGMGQVRLTSPS